MTQESLLDALTEDLSALFRHYRLKNSAGEDRSIQVYPQDLPFREGPDEEPEEHAPEPYIIVRLPSGELPVQDMIREALRLLAKRKGCSRWKTD